MISARAVVATAGTLTVVVVFVMARRMGGAVLGLLSAFFLAVAILHVRDSHFAMTDVLMTSLFHHEPDAPAPRAGCYGARPRQGRSRGSRYRDSSPDSRLRRSTTPERSSRRWPERRSGSLHIDGTRRGRCSHGCRRWHSGSFSSSDSLPERLSRFSTTRLLQTTCCSTSRASFRWARRRSRPRLDLSSCTTTLPYGVGIPVFLAAIVGVVPVARRFPRDALVLGLFAVAFYLAIGSGRTVFFGTCCHSCRFSYSRGRGHRAAGTWLAARVMGFVPGAAWSTLGSGRRPGIGELRVVRRSDVAHGLAGTRGGVVGDAREADRRVLRQRRRLYAAAACRVEASLLGIRFATESFRVRWSGIPDWMVLYESPLQVNTPTPPVVSRLRGTDTYSCTRSATTPRPASAVFDLQDAFFMPVSGFDEVRRRTDDPHLQRREASTAGSNEPDRGTSR